jgi:hypothetical protein
MIPLNEDNAKKIWTKLRKYLDPLKAAVKEAIKAKKVKLAAIH